MQDVSDAILILAEGDDTVAKRIRDKKAASTPTSSASDAIRSAQTAPSLPSRSKPVESAIEQHYTTLRLQRDEAENVRAFLTNEVRAAHKYLQAEATRQRARLRRLERQRRKLMETYYADAVPLELFKEEQDRISGETEEASLSQHLRLLAVGQVAVEVVSLLTAPLLLVLRVMRAE